MKEKRTRREFLSGAVRVAATALFGPVVTGCLSRSALQGGEGAHWFGIDSHRCIGCGACVRACREEHGTPPGVTRTWIERHILDKSGKVSIESPGGGENGFEIGEKAVADSSALFLPKLCNQCSDPPCVRYCPVGALFRTADGFVLTDPSRCIGCALCVKACPYGARFKNPVIGISGGCDWCHQRVSRGLDPVCVRVCPTRARLFGSGSSGKPRWFSTAKPLDAEAPWKTGARVVYSMLGPKSDV